MWSMGETALMPPGVPGGVVPETVREGCSGNGTRSLSVNVTSVRRGLRGSPRVGLVVVVVVVAVVVEEEEAAVVVVVVVGDCAWG